MIGEHPPMKPHNKILEPTFGQRMTRTPVLAALVLAACSAAGGRESLGSHDPGGPPGGFGGSQGSGAASSGGSQGSASGGSQGSASGGTQPIGGVGGAASDGGKVDSGTCASADVRVTRVVTTVWLVIERSLLMNNPVPDGNTTVWETAREALMGTAGAITNLQSAVAFGAVLHSGGAFREACPNLTTVDPALNNSPAIATVYSAQTQFTNPVTADALDYVRGKMASGAGDAGAGERIVVLVKSNLNTDADCTNPGETVSTRMITAAQRLVTAGAKLFVMSVPLSPNNLHTTDVELARIGNTGHDVFTPDKQAEIASVLKQILSEQVSCDILLNGTVTLGNECQGTVKIDGVPIACNDPNGWRMKNEHTVEFVGTACTDLRAKPQANVRADFPCKVFRPVPR